MFLGRQKLFQAVPHIILSDIYINFALHRLLDFKKCHKQTLVLWAHVILVSFYWCFQNVIFFIFVDSKTAMEGTERPRFTLAHSYLEGFFTFFGLITPIMSCFIRANKLVNCQWIYNLVIVFQWWHMASFPN